MIQNVGRRGGGGGGWMQLERDVLYDTCYIRGQDTKEGGGGVEVGKGCVI